MREGFYHIIDCFTSVKLPNAFCKMFNFPIVCKEAKIIIICDFFLGLVSVISHAQLKFIANVSEVVGYDGDFWTGLNDQKFEGNKKLHTFIRFTFNVPHHYSQKQQT